MSSIHVQESGGGYPVVLIHGFPFNHTIWDVLRKKLDDRFRIVTPDLPGFGKSPLEIENISIADAGQSILKKLDELKIQKCVLIGHSLGGYVAMAMGAQRPELFAGLVLFHSTTQADSEEKKENRNKTIDFVRNNGAEAFTGKFVAPLFHSPEHPGIKTARDIAVQAKERTVLAYLAAMRDRPDTTVVMKSFSGPVLIIAGDSDSAVPLENLKKLSGLSSNTTLEVLKDTGHMGMIEQPEKSASIIEGFLRNVTGSSKK